jgi:hypothetical protein
MNKRWRRLRTTVSTFRTDDNNNPTAFTTAIAAEALLVQHVDYEQGTQFPNGEQLWTAKLLGDPITITIRVIDALGFYVGNGPGTSQRWEEIAMLYDLWMALSTSQKTAVIGIIYTFEGGTAMKGLFAE